MAWWHYALGLYLILVIALLLYIKKNWFWFVNTYRALYAEKQKVAESILTAKDGKEKRKLIKKNIFKIS